LWAGKRPRSPLFVQGRTAENIKRRVGSSVRRKRLVPQARDAAAKKAHSVAAALAISSTQMPSPVRALQSAGPFEQASRANASRIATAPLVPTILASPLVTRIVVHVMKAVSLAARPARRVGHQRCRHLSKPAALALALGVALRSNFEIRTIDRVEQIIERVGFLEQIDVAQLISHQPIFGLGEQSHCNDFVPVRHVDKISFNASVPPTTGRQKSA
jgi:hypothetical protein